ncbi:MAG TPA: T9SS type A sorting domain-containing protein, partial [Flavobacteriales bacterium]|nr:T9SS type A sorting domain-containing protein [Flavobacteriales bacterium]
DLHAVQSNRITIYKNELKAGLYIVELSNETKQFRERVIIK